MNQSMREAELRSFNRDEENIYKSQVSNSSKSEHRQPPIDNEQGRLEEKLMQNSAHNS
jgi:hypothetical protein